MRLVLAIAVVTAMLPGQSARDLSGYLPPDTPLLLDLHDAAACARGAYSTGAAGGSAWSSERHVSSTRSTPGNRLRPTVLPPSRLPSSSILRDSGK